MKKWKRVLWEWLTGDSKKMQQRCARLYGQKDYSDRIGNMKSNSAKKYGLLALCTLLILGAALIEGKIKPESGIIIKEGKIISILRPKAEKGPVTISAKLSIGEGKAQRTERATLIIRPEEKEVKKADASEKKVDKGGVNVEIDRIVKVINRSNTGKEVVLPVSAAGHKISWEQVEKSRVLPIIITSLFGALLIYRGRYDRLKKEEREAAESVIAELPEFINKIILLLNAGLVLTTAFTRIMEDFGKAENEKVPYFYQQLRQACRNMSEMNSPMAVEFKEFARRSGVKELMRLSNILADNLDKGAGLVEKLQGESEMLWLAKKKQSEEKGRLAESKMTFPLMLLLLILIMVTVSPALIEM